MLKKQSIYFCLNRVDFNFYKEFNISIDTIKKECKAQNITKIEQIQYVLATALHETAGKMRPVAEAFWVKNPKRYRKNNRRIKRYYPYYGRGYVQLTWRENYAKYSKILELDLVKYPNLALEEKNAVFILVHGMKHGIFTGKKLDDYFNEFGSNFIGARAIVNGKDRAEHIAKIAQTRFF